MSLAIAILNQYCAEENVDERLPERLAIEAQILAEPSIRAALH